MAGSNLKKRKKSFDSKDDRASAQFQHLVKYKGRMVEVGGKDKLVETTPGSYERKSRIKKKLKK